MRGLITRSSPWIRSDANLVFEGGKVGIGISDPSTLLDIKKGADDDDSILRLSTTSTTRDASIGFTTAGGNDWAIGIDASDSDKFKLSDNTTLGTNDRFVIDSSGNVGIGTATPGTALEVTGTIATTNANGPALVDEEAGNTNPTLIPDRSDLTAGIGYDAGNLKFITSGVRRLEISGDGTFNVSNNNVSNMKNVGIGVYLWGTNAEKVIGISADGVVPATSPAGMIQIFADDSSGGAVNATLALRTEEAVVSEVLASDSTLNIWINGTEYHLLLRAV